MNAPDRYVVSTPPELHIFLRCYISYGTLTMSDFDDTPQKGGRLPAGQWSNASGYACNRDPRVGNNVGSKLQADNLSPERHESFLLAVGEKKIEYEPETRKQSYISTTFIQVTDAVFLGVPNAAMFTFNKEDHTLGNLLRAKLVKADHVLFAGYQVPHPLQAMFKLRVQTDGEVNPKEAVVQACQDLVKELQMLDQEFTKEWELKKIAGGVGDL